MCTQYYWEDFTEHSEDEKNCKVCIKSKFKWKKIHTSQNDTHIVDIILQVYINSHLLLTGLSFRLNCNIIKHKMEAHYLVSLDNGIMLNDTNKAHCMSATMQKTQYCKICSYIFITYYNIYMIISSAYQFLIRKNLRCCERNTQALTLELDTQQTLEKNINDLDTVNIFRNVWLD